MTDRYISIDTVKDICISLISNYDLYDREQAFCIAAINSVADMVDKASAADVVERKKGEWELDRRGVVCTCCNRLIYIEPHILELNTLEMWWMDYCPNCGAEMRTEE